MSNENDKQGNEVEAAARAAVPHSVGNSNPRLLQTSSSGSYVTNNQKNRKKKGSNPKVLLYHAAVAKYKKKKKMAGLNKKGSSRPQDILYDKNIHLVMDNPKISTGKSDPKDILSSEANDIMAKIAAISKLPTFSQPQKLHGADADKYYNSKGLDIPIPSAKLGALDAAIIKQDDNTVTKTVDNIEDDDIGDWALKMDFFDIAKEIIDTYEGEFYANLKEEKIYLYNAQTGCFESKGKAEIYSFIRSFYLGDEYVERRLNRSLLGNATSMIIQRPSLQIKAAMFDNNKYLLCVKNGVIDCRIGKLIDHSPKYRMLRSIPLNYGNNQVPVKFMGLLKRMFVTEENIRFALQVMAFLISNFGAELKKCPVFVGSGDSGKTLFANLILRFFADEDISAMALHDIGKGFGMAKLLTSRINYGDEVDNKPIRNPAFLKAILSNTKLPLNFKNKDVETTKCTTKLFFSANDISRLAQTVSDKALFKRFIFLPFYNPIKEHEKILDYDEIIFREEGEAILTMLVDMLVKLYKNNMVFDLSLESIKTYDSFCNSVKQSLPQFLEEKCDISSGLRIIKEFLYRAYLLWCQEKKLPPSQILNKINFFKELYLMPGIYETDRFRGVDPETGLKVDNPQASIGGIDLRK